MDLTLTYLGTDLPRYCFPRTLCFVDVSLVLYLTQTRPSSLSMILQLVPRYRALAAGSCSWYPGARMPAGCAEFRGTGRQVLSRNILLPVGPRSWLLNLVEQDAWSCYVNLAASGVRKAEGGPAECWEALKGSGPRVPVLG